MIEPAIRRRIGDIVGDGQMFEDSKSRLVMSRDYSWISPILRRELHGMLADLIVAPETACDAGRVLSVAFGADVPVTVRGRGTGNYGQAVPLAGGIVLDFSRIAETLDVGDGWITAEAGATFVDLEAEARRCGQELAVFPSTTRSTLGGFIGGGAGGIGSIEHGFVWDGLVSALEVVPCVDNLLNPGRLPAAAVSAGASTGEGVTPAGLPNAPSPTGAASHN